MFIGIVLCYFIVLPISKGEDKLLAVSLLYRHGDRTPTDFYPTDPYQDPSFWPAPPGELTNIGKLQHYELGKWLRNRYDNFLSQTYNKDEIYIRSADADRCLMSAECNLAGLFPPQSKDVWNTELSWQPIPVHTVPTNQDDIAEAGRCCSKFRRLVKEAMENSYIKDINDENKEFYQFLTNKTGETISDILDVGTLHEVLFVEKLYNFTLPSWANDNYSKIKNLTEIASKIQTFTPQIGRFFIGRFLEEVISQFLKIERNSTNTTEHKFKIFSAHDGQVYGILNQLKVPNLKKVPYTGMVIFELKFSEKNEYYVEVFYKTEKEVPDVVQIDGCGSKCNFNDFLSIVQPSSITKEDFIRECE